MLKDWEGLVLASFRNFPIFFLYIQPVLFWKTLENKIPIRFRFNMKLTLKTTPLDTTMSPSVSDERLLETPQHNLEATSTTIVTT